MPAKFLRLRPRQGSRLCANTSIGAINIFSVENSTGKAGTKVPYKTAIRLLKTVPPIVTIVPDKDCKIDPEDQEEIDNLVRNYFLQNSALATPVDTKAGNKATVSVSTKEAIDALAATEELKIELAAKDEILKAQTQKINDLTEAVNKLIDAQAEK